MDEERIQVLRQLLQIASPSGDEVAAARFWRTEARRFSDDVRVDILGNSIATLQSDGPRILITGHIDEIGLMLTHIDSDGYLYFDAIGGWDPQVLVGQRVRLLGHQGDIVGVIGKKPIHLIEQEERNRAAKIKNLWIDIGAQSREQAEEWVQVGCPAVIDVLPCDMLSGRLVSRSIDNRIGAFIALESFRLLAQNPPVAHVAAIATVQEEITMAGAITASFQFDPHIAIIIDVTWTSDHPESNKRQVGDVSLGGGPVLSRGSANHALVYERLLDIAIREQIPYQLQSTPRRTSTDADAIQLTRAGVATATISIPCRYMHSPNEMIDLTDVVASIQLITAFVASVQQESEFVPV